MLGAGVEVWARDGHWTLEIDVVEHPGAEVPTDRGGRSLGVFCVTCGALSLWVLTYVWLQEFSYKEWWACSQFNSFFFFFPQISFCSVSSVIHGSPHLLWCHVFPQFPAVPPVFLDPSPCCVPALQVLGVLTLIFLRRGVKYFDYVSCEAVFTPSQLCLWNLTQMTGSKWYCT